MYEKVGSVGRQAVGRQDSLHDTTSITQEEFFGSVHSLKSTYR